MMINFSLNYYFNGIRKQDIFKLCTYGERKQLAWLVVKPPPLPPSIYLYNDSQWTREQSYGKQAIDTIIKKLKGTNSLISKINTNRSKQWDGWREKKMYTHSCAHTENLELKLFIVQIQIFLLLSKGKMYIIQQ